VTWRRSSSGRVSEGSGRPNAGVVDQNVDRTGFVLNLTDQGADLRRIGQVGRMRGASQFGRERMNGVLSPGDERDSCPRPGEGVSERLADAS